MKKTISIPKNLRGRVEEFIRKENLEITRQEDAVVNVVQCDGERIESDMKTLYAGGWIACQTAREMAGELGIANRAMGRLLDLLDVKIRECELGCF